MKAYELAGLLNKLGWRSDSDAQYDHLTRAVEDMRLMAALIQDIKAIAAEDARND